MSLPDENRSDEELLQSFFEGAEPAFECLAERWRTRLWGVFLKRGLRGADVEDLVQEVIVRLYVTRDLPDFDPHQPLAGYVLTVARNLAINRLRGNREEPAGDLEIECGDPEGTLLTRQTAEDITDCLAYLDEETRSVILLCEKHGLGTKSHKEIAELWEKWPSQVSTLCAKSRALLRTCLERKGYR